MDPSIFPKIVFVKKYFLSLPIFGLLLLLTFLSPKLCFAAEIGVIVNKSQNTPALSAQDLQLIYKGKKKVWGNGENIILFLPPIKSEAMQFLVKEVFKKNSESEVSRFYLQAVFQQVFVNPPKSVANTRYAVAVISANPGGIAIVDLDELPPDSNVNIVLIKDSN